MTTARARRSSPRPTAVGTGSWCQSRPGRPRPRARPRPPRSSTALVGSPTDAAFLERDAPDRARRALDAARAGSGRVVWVAGEAGIGKTTLARRFAAAAGRQRPRAPGRLRRPAQTTAARPDQGPRRAAPGWTPPGPDRRRERGRAVRVPGRPGCRPGLRRRPRGPALGRRRHARHVRQVAGRVPRAARRAGPDLPRGGRRARSSAPPARGRDPGTTRGPSPPRSAQCARRRPVGRRLRSRTPPRSSARRATAVRDRAHRGADGTAPGDASRTPW